MNNLPVYSMFLLYLLMMIFIGGYFYKRAKKIEDYLLGGRKMGSYVTALSAQASDMSGWLLMGLPGAIYLYGLNQIWIAVGLVIGTYLNWYFTAPRLRLYTAKTSSLTISSFFANRYKDPTNLLRLISSVITLLFFTVYAAAGLVGAGKLFESMFGLNYMLAVAIGTSIMIFYTLLGGFLAVCWTDLFQAILMVFAIVVLPFLVYFTADTSLLANGFALREGTLNIMPAGTTAVAILAIISSAGWGLGYFGQPHILVRFMSVKQISLLPRARRIAMSWVLVSLAGAVVIGLLAIPLYPTLATGEEEKVLIYMVRDFVNPFLGGILLAAILAAIMSTIDSQLLVSSSTLTEDFYAAVVNKKATQKQLMFVTRASVLLISVIAFILAMDRSSNIFKLVTFAWGGFGAAFGPVIIMSLYSRKTTWYSALAGMMTGTIVMLLWYAFGLSEYMYEIVSGFIMNFVVIFIINYLSSNKDKAISDEFDDVVKNVVSKHTPE